MTDQTLQLIIKSVHYLAILLWILLTLIIARQLLKRDYNGLKISGLYLFNSIIFIVAWGMILNLALIVMAPIAETKEKSIELLQFETNDYFRDYILFSLATTFILSILNILYLKFIGNKKITKHSLILLFSTLIILLAASYIATDWYYRGLLGEIERHF